MDNANRGLSELLRPHGFVAKRNCFYRKLDTRILQFIKFEYEPWLSRYELRIGLYSLYSELHPHWLTPSGCISRYPVAALSNDIKCAEGSPDAQLDILHEYGIPWLDAMHTQRNLVDAMCEIELKESGRILWVDSLKLAPFLVSEDYIAAECVISSILQQHTGPDAWTSQSWTESDYEMYRKRYPGKDLKLIEIHEWIRGKDYGAVESYLQNNFIINSRNIKLT